MSVVSLTDRKTVQVISFVKLRVGWTHHVQNGNVRPTLIFIIGLRNSNFLIFNIIYFTMFSLPKIIFIVRISIFIVHQRPRTKNVSPCGFNRRIILSTSIDCFVISIFFCGIWWVNILCIVIQFRVVLCMVRVLRLLGWLVPTQIFYKFFLILIHDSDYRTGICIWTWSIMIPAQFQFGLSFCLIITWTSLCSIWVWQILLLLAYHIGGENVVVVFPVEIFKFIRQDAVVFIFKFIPACNILLVEQILGRSVEFLIVFLASIRFGIFHRQVLGSSLSEALRAVQSFNT